MSRIHHRGGASADGLSMFEHRTLVLSLGVILGAVLAVKAVRRIQRWRHEELVELEDDLLGPGATANGQAGARPAGQP